MSHKLVAVALALLIALLAGADHALAQEALRDSIFAVERTEGVVYGTAPIGVPAGDFDLLLDLYEPVGEAVPEPRPGFVIVPGAGSYRERPLLVRLASSMAGRGYTAVSIDYRQEGQQPEITSEFEPFRAAFTDSFPGNDPNQIRTWAANAEDATRALRWMVDQSDVLGVDPERIAMGGISRGATITLSVAYVIEKFGVTMDPPLRVIWEQAGALNGFHDLVETGDPPAVIIHGTADQIVHFDHAEIIRQHLHWAGVPYDFMPVEGAGHFIDLFRRDALNPLSVVDRIVNFFYLFVGPPVPVELVARGLEVRAGDVLVTWRTAFEQDLVGFDLERAEVGTAAFERINPVPIGPGPGERSRYAYIDDSVGAGMSYAYRLVSIDRSGRRETFGLGSVTVPRYAQPVAVLLGGAHPNPFNPTTTVEFELSMSTSVRLLVHASSGRLVCTLVDGRFDAGTHAARWDGRDHLGRSLTSGIYIVTLLADDHRQSEKIVLLR